MAARHGPAAQWGHHSEGTGRTHRSCRNPRAGVSRYQQATDGAGVEREVAEEIAIKTKFEDRIVALLNDDSTEVGQVHLGVVHVFKLPEPKVEKREAMITSLAFLDKNELLARRDSLETWSQICLDSLERLMAV